MLYKGYFEEFLISYRLGLDTLILYVQLKYSLEKGGKGITHPKVNFR